MNQFLFLTKLEISETLRARWYQFYLLTITVLISVFFFFGLTESSALGFTGLGRTLLTLIQVSIIILPIFTLMTTVRTLVGDRESGVWEYNLSTPIKLSSFYWGRSLGRVLSLFLPMLLGLYMSGITIFFRGYDVPWSIIFLYSLFIGANIVCFYGMALVVSVYSKTQEMALGLAFILWIIFEGLIDALLLGLMLQQRIITEAVVGLAFLNPLQAFRMAAIALFDPELTILGPISYTILEEIGLNNILIWAVIWPVILGLILASLGYRALKTRDLL